MFLMNEAPLYLDFAEGVEVAGERFRSQETAPILGPPLDPRYSPTEGS